MIKILKYKEVENKEFFARADIKANVEDIVFEIIENVKNNGDKALLNIVKCLTGKTFVLCRECQ